MKLVRKANKYIKARKPQKNTNGSKTRLTTNTLGSYAYNGPNKDTNKFIPHNKYINTHKGS